MVQATPSIRRIIENLYVNGVDRFKGNLIEDAAQAGNVQTLSAAAYPATTNRPATMGHLLPGGNNSFPNTALHKQYELHAGLATYVGLRHRSSHVRNLACGRQGLQHRPAAGGYVGWVCTTAGSPGTWKGFNAIGQ